EELEEVRRRVDAAARTGYPLLSKIAAGITDSLARALRASLLLVCSRLGPGPVPGRFDAATAVELAGLADAMLLDVLEGGGPAPGGPRPAPGGGVKWGNMFAVMAANFLLARAYDLATRLGVECATLMSLTCAESSAGRIREIGRAREHTQTVDRYLANVGMR